MINEILNDVEIRMKKSIARLEQDFAAIRTGRANPTMFDNVQAEAYGSMMPINQMATISCPEPRLVVIQPWDKTSINAIEKAILTSGMSLNPSNDGNIIRVQIPELTEETRKEYVKQAKKIAEDSKVSIRNIRRDGNDSAKKMEKEKEISEDDLHAAEDSIQKITNKYIDIIQKVTEKKEEEILNI